MEVIKDKKGYFGDLAGEDPRDVEDGWSDIQISVAPDDVPGLILMLAHMAGLPPGRYELEEIIDRNRNTTGYSLERMGDSRERPPVLPEQGEVDERVLTADGVASQLPGCQSAVVRVPAQPGASELDAPFLRAG